MKKSTLNASIVSSVTLALVVAFNGCSGGGGGSGTASSGLASSWVGTKSLSGGTNTASTNILSVATDTQGALLVTGSATHGIDGKAAIGVEDGFVTKYDKNGNKLWTKQIAGSSAATVYGVGVAADGSDNVYVTGFASEGLDGNTVSTSASFFLTKYDTLGNKLWTHQLDATGTVPHAIAVDSAGNAYIAGTTSGTLVTGNPATGVTDAFLIKYDTTGTGSWYRHKGFVAKNASGNTVSIAANGDVLFAGSTEGGISGAQNGVLDGFIVRYTSAGTLNHQKQFGTAGVSVTFNSITSDASNEVFVAGSTTGSVFSQTFVAGAGHTDFFVAKFDAIVTNLLWAIEDGVSGQDSSLTGVKTDPSGGVYASGYSQGAVDSQTLNGTTDVIVTHYDANGTFLWTTQKGVASATSEAKALYVDSEGNSFVGGESDGGFAGISAVGTSAFLAKFNSDGDIQ